MKRGGYIMLKEITNQAKTAAEELIAAAKIKDGALMVVGCSSSEICGSRLGTNSSVETAQAVFDGLYPVLKKNGIYLAAQCCEHLNRALIVEKECAQKFGFTIVNAVPQPKAGGSFATTAYREFDDACTVEKIKADAGMDIGGVLIGMHLKRTAVPVRVSLKQIGEAVLICARTRPKFVGGERAVYNPELL